MSLMDNLRWAWSVLADPNKNIKPMTAGGAIAAYYKVSVIPVIVAIIIGAIVGGLTAGGLGVVGVVVSLAIGYWVLVPIGLIIAAALYQLFAKFITRMVTGDFSKTMMALVYGVMPTLVFVWFAPIPIIGQLVLFLLAIYGAVIAFVALTKLHNAPMGRVFVGFFITAIICLLVLLAVAYTLVAPYLGALSTLGGLSTTGLGTTGGIGGYP